MHMGDPITEEGGDTRTQEGSLDSLAKETRNLTTLDLSEGSVLHLRTILLFLSEQLGKATCYSLCEPVCHCRDS